MEGRSQKGATVQTLHPGSGGAVDTRMTVSSRREVLVVSAGLEQLCVMVEEADLRRSHQLDGFVDPLQNGLELRRVLIDAGCTKLEKQTGVSLRRCHVER